MEPTLKPRQACISSRCCRSLVVHSSTIVIPSTCIITGARALAFFSLALTLLAVPSPQAYLSISDRDWAVLTTVYQVDMPSSRIPMAWYAALPEVRRALISVPHSSSYSTTDSMVHSAWSYWCYRSSLGRSSFLLCWSSVGTSDRVCCSTHSSTHRSRSCILR